MEIALSLSGGGYRAAVYHIGVLSYLDTIIDDSGKSLLESVSVLSSVSGGSLTSLWYVLNKARGISTADSLRSLYSLIVDNDIEKELFEDFKTGAVQGNTLIMQLARVYDKLFFHGERYETILSYIQNPQTCIHHYAVCATDFNNGRPFHFYASREITLETKRIQQFKIGHSTNNIDYRVAGSLAISDIMAASSCFPGVFEPFVFPDDFQLEHKEAIAALTNSFSLMDGGVVDNQGFEAIRKLDHEYWDIANTNLEMIIVSDVAKAEPQKFQRSEIRMFDKDDNVTDTIEKHLPWFVVHRYLFCVLCSMFLLVFVYAAFGYDGWIRLLSVGLIGVTFTILSVYVYSRCVWFPSKYQKIVAWGKEKFTKDLTFYFDESFVFKLRTNSVLDFFNNRLKSLVLMSSDVMMGQIRKFKLRQAFAGGDDFRTVINAIYALTPKGTWRSLDKKVDKILRPSIELNGISNEVANIDTTLCFTEKQKRDDIPQKLVACGQFTTCWNLLLIINRLKSIPQDQWNNTQSALVALETKIKDDWDHFNHGEPYYKSII